MKVKWHYEFNNLYKTTFLLTYQIQKKYYLIKFGKLYGTVYYFLFPLVNTNFFSQKYSLWKQSLYHLNSAHHEE